MLRSTARLQALAGRMLRALAMAESQKSYEGDGQQGSKATADAHLGEALQGTAEAKPRRWPAGAMHAHRRQQVNKR